MTDIATEEINRLHEILKENYLELATVGDELNGFTTVATGDEGEGRWSSHEWVVSQSPVGNFYRWEWERGLTEYQDHEYYEDKPVQVSKSVRLVEEVTWTKV